MGCGCKKKTQQTTTQGTNINTQVSLQNVTPSSNITLTEEQQKAVNEIVDKINKISQ